MFDIYGNPPNHPVLMRLPAPTQVRHIQLSDLSHTRLKKILKVPFEFTNNDLWANDELRNFKSF